MLLYYKVVTLQLVVVFSFSIFYSLEVSHQVQPTFKGRTIKLHLLGREFSSYYLELFCKEDLLVPPLSTLKFINHLSISVWTQYLKNILGYNPILWLFCCSYCCSPVPWELFQFDSCVPLICPYLGGGNFPFCHCKIFQDHPFFFFFCLGHRISFFSKEPWFLSLENDI